MSWGRWFCALSIGDHGTKEMTQPCLLYLPSHLFGCVPSAATWSAECPKELVSPMQPARSSPCSSSSCSSCRTIAPST